MNKDNLKISKVGFIASCQPGGLWQSHMMAPAPILFREDIIRVFVGGWDGGKISRIYWVDVDRKNPIKVLDRSTNPVLDIGIDGAFDENGVFPAHAYNFDDGRVFLFYTGFQLGHKIRHYNFGGLAVSLDHGGTFARHSQSPVLDRSDEGLYVRAGQSIERSERGGYHVVYSAGSSWYPCNDELRPKYDVFYQHSGDGIAVAKTGLKILDCDLSIEHGLGRPQIIRLGGSYYVFYTRRIIKDMRYSMGAAVSKDCISWERVDGLFEALSFGSDGEFDSEMMYFPGVVKVSETQAYLFYSGNYFGRDGMGVMELRFDR